MTATVPPAARFRARTLVHAGLLATVAAAAATTVIALVGRSAGISLDIAEEPIPLWGFAQLTAIFSLLGVGLAVMFARRASSPRGGFVRTTLALTALSLVPDVLADAAWDTRILLMATHLVAAAIVIPPVAARLPE